MQAVQNNTLIKAFIPEGPGEQEGRSNSQAVTSWEWEYIKTVGRQVTKDVYISKGRLNLDTVTSSGCPGMVGGGAAPFLEAPGIT